MAYQGRAGRFGVVDRFSAKFAGIKEVLPLLDEYKVAQYSPNHLGLVELREDGEDILHTSSVEVPDNPDLRWLLRDLFKYILFDVEGSYRSAGVSAIQFGYNLRAFGAKLENNDLLAIFNPVFTHKSDGMMMTTEGCLSIREGRDSFGVKRHTEVHLEWEDEEGEKQEGVFWTDPKLNPSWEPIIIQHEYDHLEGILISDDVKRVKPTKAQGSVGRNDPCPCKSGKKYKHCCGR